MLCSFSLFPPPPLPFSGDKKAGYDEKKALIRLVIIVLRLTAKDTFRHTSSEYICRFKTFNNNKEIYQQINVQLVLIQKPNMTL